MSHLVFCFLLHFGLASHLIYIDTVVDCANEAVDDLHEFCGVSAQVESLLRVAINIPIKFCKIIYFLLHDELLQEVEFDFTFTFTLRVTFTFTLRVHVCLQLNDLEVEQLRLLIRIFQTDVLILRNKQVLMDRTVSHSVETGFISSFLFLYFLLNQARAKAIYSLGKGLRHFSLTL